MRQTDFHGGTVKAMDLFRRYPNRWIRADVFMRIAGSCGWRTRISNARLRMRASGEGEVLPARVTTLKDKRTGKKYKISEYCFQPAAWLYEQQGLPVEHEVNL